MIATTALLCAHHSTYLCKSGCQRPEEKYDVGSIPGFAACYSLQLITMTLIQLLIQRRIVTLSDQYLKRDQQRSTDEEAAGNAKKYQMVASARCIAPTWLLLYLLLIGLQVGYVGCFCVVQNSTSTICPVSWLCFEAGLSVMRVAIWACQWNPTCDDAPPLAREFILKLDKHNPLPTCNKVNEEVSILSPIL